MPDPAEVSGRKVRARPAGQSSSPAPPDQTHRCVVLVHGIGEEARGQTLLDIGEPLAAFLDNRLGRVEVDETDLSPAEAVVASSRVRIGDDVLLLREAWWAKRFLAPPYTPVLVWTIRIWWSQSVSLFHGLLHSLGLDDFLSARGVPVVPPIKPPDDEPVYTSPPLTPISRVYDLLMGLALIIFFTLGTPLVLLLVVVGWTLQGLGDLLNFSAPSRAATALLEQVYVRYIGDVYVYFNSHQVRASIRDAVSAAILPSLDPAHRSCRGLTIIAHSWGTVVALDSLLHLSQLQDIDRRPLTLMTFGAALNRVWWMGRSDPMRPDRRDVAAFWQDLVRVPQMREWLGAIRWANLWSRYDPVSAGPLEPGLREHLAPTGLRPIERRVVNLDDPLADHTAYWANAPEVQSRIAYEVLGHRVPALAPIQACVDQTAARRAVVGWLAFARLSAIVVGALLMGALARQLTGLPVPWGDPGALRGWTSSLALLYLIALASVLVLSLPPRGRLAAAILIVALVAATGLLDLLGSGAIKAVLGRGLDLLVGWFRSLSPFLQAGIDLALLVASYKMFRYFWFGPRLEDRPSAVGAPAAVPRDHP